MSAAAEEKIQRLDAEISHYFGLMKDLMSQRNALVPISRLPAEMLGRIFREVRDSIPEGRVRRSSPVYTKPGLEWISVSHVSQHWRNVAINDPTLWTKLPLNDLKWTMIMLERSRTAIIPTIWLADGPHNPVVTALVPHISRASSLVIRKTTARVLKQILSALPSAAPEIETLWVNSSTKEVYQDQFHNWPFSLEPPSHDEAVTFPDSVLCRTPKLRHLGLNNVIIKSDSPLLSSLTTLSMCGLPEKSKPTSQEFITMLKSAPCLKRLTLKCVCPSPQSNQQTAWTLPLQMQHLESLYIEETIPRVVHAFGILSATCLLKKLTINCHYTTEGSSSNIPPLFAVLNQPYLYSVMGSSMDVRRLRIHNLNEHFIIQGSKISGSERNLEPSKRKNLDYSNTMTIAFVTPEFDEDHPIEPTNSDFISILFNSFTWTGLSELDLSELHAASPRVLASTFGTIPTLRILMIDTNIAPSMFKALNYQFDLALSGATNSASLSFPSLQHIDMKFSGTKLNLGSPNLKALCKSLKRRQEYGIPIISLKFSYLAEEIILLLKKHVEHVVWNPSGSNHGVLDNFSPYDYDWYI